jgi:membrane fusion protein (multidrug efflux system)
LTDSRRIALWLAVTALGALCGACGDKKEERPRGPRPVAVRAEAVAVGDLTRSTEHPGELFAEAVDVSPRLSGTLVEVPVRLGDRVEKGDLLARIDDAELSHQLREAQAATAAAEANARRAEAQLALARTELQRKAPLAEDQLVSAQEMSELQSRVASLEADAAAATAQAQQSRARAKLFQEQRSHTRLVAPFDGIVAERRLDPGATVGPTTPILRLVSAGLLRVRFRLPEQALAQVQPGLPLRVFTAATKERGFPGKVERVGGEVSRADRSIQVEGVLTEEVPVLKPGMYARVGLSEERLEDVLLVPSEAIVSRLFGREERTAVFVAESERARLVPVAVLGREGDRTAVRGALGAGAPVLTLGHEELSDGSPIRVVESEWPQRTEAAREGGKG